jgi:hypothetical protein
VASASYVHFPVYKTEHKSVSGQLNGTSNKYSSYLQRSYSSKIPYTQRSASIKGLVVMRYFYGEPSFFFTYSPDYIYRVLDIRLSVPQVNNEDFWQVDFLVWTFCSNSTWGIHLPYVYPYVFVVPVASFGNVEEQARGSLHMHVVC